MKFENYLEEGKLKPFKMVCADCGERINATKKIPKKCPNCGKKDLRQFLDLFEKKKKKKKKKGFFTKKEKGNPGVTDKSPSEYEKERKNKKSRYDPIWEAKTANYKKAKIGGKVWMRIWKENPELQDEMLKWRKGEEAKFVKKLQKR